MFGVTAGASIRSGAQITAPDRPAALSCVQVGRGAFASRGALPVEPHGVKRDYSPNRSAHPTTLANEKKSRNAGKRPGVPAPPETSVYRLLAASGKPHTLRLMNNAPEASRNARPAWASIGRHVLDNLRPHRGLIAFCAAYWAACALTFRWVWGAVFLGMEPRFWVAIVTSAMFCFLIANVIAWQASWVLSKRWGRPLRVAITAQAAPARIGRAAVVLILFAPFATAFGKMKILIPVLHPFSQDAWLSRADVWLHGGAPPWQWLAPWLLNGPAVEALVMVYERAWMALVLCLLLCAALDTRPRRRMQCLYSFFGCWALLGSVLGLVLSSAGPVFYERVVGTIGPYSALITKLAELDARGLLTPLPVSQALWQSYLHPGVENLALGISAMPSLHVSMACLTWLYARRFGRVPGWIAAAYLVVIMTGSVMLGWHYAIDGYVAMAGTVLIWWGAGKIVQATPGQRSVSEQNARLP